MVVATSFHLDLLWKKVRTRNQSCGFVVACLFLGKHISFCVPGLVFALAQGALPKYSSNVIYYLS